MFIQEQRGDVVILRMQGMPGGFPAEELLHNIKQVIREGISKVVVDFSDKTFVGCRILGALAVSLTTLWEAGGNLYLIPPNNLLELRATRLIQVFRIFESVDDAVKGFAFSAPSYSEELTEGSLKPYPSPAHRRHHAHSF